MAEEHRIIPDIRLDDSVSHFLSLDSRAALDLQYAALRRHLTPEQLSAVDANLTAAFGGRTTVSYGGVGVVALALSFLLESVASHLNVSGGSFARAFGSENPSEISRTVNEYFKLVSGSANDIREMGELTELYDQRLKHALIELYESMALDHRLNTSGIKHWINGAAIHLHVRIHGIRLASVPKGTAESLRLSYRTALSRLIQLYTGYLRHNVRERSAAVGPPRRAGFLIVEPGRKIRHRVLHNHCESPAIASAVMSRILEAQKVQTTSRFFDETGDKLNSLLLQRDTFELFRDQHISD